MTIIAAFVASLAMMTATAAGDWHGTLDLGVAKLKLVFHIDAAANPPTATMDSPDQGAKGIPAVVDWCEGDSLALSVPAINFKYAGRVKDGRLAGTLTQHGRSFPLTLESGSGEPPRRPQTPAPPYPYATEEVSFESTGEHPATLSGTLALPDGAKDHPVVVMVTGSGLQDRDETLFDHRPFAVIADRLARAGLASLRYDDRGFGKSTGDAASGTTVDNAADAAAAVKYLRDRGFRRVGILGHSEGGAIAFMLAARGDADFVVTLGAPAVKGDSLIVEQVNALAPESGMTVERYREAQPWRGNPWLEWFVNYDPSSDISAVKVPAMVLAGERDIQVRPASGAERIRSLLPAGKSNLIKTYPGLNHLMQHCETGAVGEYNQIEETISEEVLADITAWLLALPAVK